MEAHLDGCGAELVTPPPLGDLREVVDQPLEDVCGVQVAVVVDVDVHHALGVYTQTHTMDVALYTLLHTHTHTHTLECCDDRCHGQMSMRRPGQNKHSFIYLKLSL